MLFLPFSLHRMIQTANDRRRLYGSQNHKASEHTFSVLAVLACGCGKHEGQKCDVKTDFSADFTAEYRGLSLKGNVLSTRQGVCVIGLKQPETLDGVEFCYRDNELEIRCDGMKASADEAYLPDAGFPSLLHKKRLLPRQAYPLLLRLLPRDSPLQT